jgi:CubicO group peptidase (beta-lactamase class C family)
VEAFADSFFTQYQREYADPSLAVVVVRGDSILFMKGYGTEDGQRPVDPETTVFNVASLSKLVVVTAIMRLVEQGAVALDDDIRPLIGAVRIRGRGPAVTLRHLLTHTSGLEGPFLRDVVSHPSQLVSLREYFTAHPPRRGRAPGEETRYSNYSMALAAYVVEQVSGESFQDYAERHVFVPLEMRRSTFRQPPPAGLAERVATAGAGRVPDALLLYPAGSMVSSPADMGRFMVSFLQNGRAASGRILSEASVGAVQTAQWRADPRVPGVALGFFESALGGEPGLFHTGARTHFSLLYLLPKRKVGVFVVHSMRQGGVFQTLRSDFVREFVARYFPQPLQPRPPSAGATARAEPVSGVYRPHLLPTTTIERAAGLFSDTHVTVRSDGLLEVKIPGGPLLVLSEVDTDLYHSVQGDEEGLRIAFGRDPSGRVRQMSLSGNTQDPITFRRLAWHQRGLLHAGLLGIIFLLFVGCTIAVSAAAAARRVRPRPRPIGPPGPRYLWAAPAVAGFLLAASPVSVALLLLMNTAEDSAAGALRFALAVGCTFLLAGVVVGLALVPLSWRVWRGGYWSRPRRVYFFTLAVGVTVAAPLLLHYHLLGYWF